ncbi:MAG: hypothetical protein JW981_04760 [Anaerolineae bacterium]|nr:hypothetical protein [Anaerolineae bacterium]
MNSKSILSAKVDQLVTSMKQSLQTKSVTSYEESHRLICKLDTDIREAFQELLRKHYKPIISKLENGGRLSQEERNALELLIVGEAKFYVDLENDYENWVREIGRLVSEIEKLQTAGLATVEDILHLQALCRDARNVLPDIAFYLREQERVKYFQSAMLDSLDMESRRFLADMIRGMMTSDRL